MAMYHGQGNGGPAREVWRVGDRVRLVGISHLTGTVREPPYDQERNASQTGWVWVRWDDIAEGSWADPNGLDVS